MWQNNSQRNMRNHLLRHSTHQKYEGGQEARGGRDLQLSIFKPKATEAYKEVLLLILAKVYFRVLQ